MPQNVKCVSTISEANCHARHSYTNGLLNNIHPMMWASFRSLVKRYLQWMTVTNKSSAVAEMGDRLATLDMGRKVGGCCAPSAGRAGSPSNTLCLGRGLCPHQVASWSIQLFGHNRHAPRIGAPYSWGEELVPYLTQCGRGRGLPPCQVLSRTIH